MCVCVCFVLIKKNNKFNYSKSMYRMGKHSKVTKSRKLISLIVSSDRSRFSISTVFSLEQVMKRCYKLTVIFIIIICL